MEVTSDYKSQTLTNSVNSINASKNNCIKVESNIFTSCDKQDISSFAKNLNEYSKYFKQIQNNSAYNGVDALASAIYENPSFQDYLIQSEADKYISYAKNDDDLFSMLFSLIEKMNDKNIDMQKFFQTLNNIDSYELKKKFVAASSKVISMDMSNNELKKTFNGFLDNVNQITTDKNLSKFQRETKLYSFFESVNMSSEPIDIQNLI